MNVTVWLALQLQELNPDGCIQPHDVWDVLPDPRVTYRFGWPRCTGCGHRVTWNGQAPVMTRKMPRLWLTEHVLRWRARREGA